MGISVRKVEGEPEYVGIYAREGLRRESLYEISGANTIRFAYGPDDHVIDVRLDPGNGTLEITTPHEGGLHSVSKYENQAHRNIKVSTYELLPAKDGGWKTNQDDHRNAYGQ